MSQALQKKGGWFGGIAYRLANAKYRLTKPICDIATSITFAAGPWRENYGRRETILAVAGDF
jgi:hypothetical protein